VTLSVWLLWGMGSQIVLHTLYWQSVSTLFVDPANAYWAFSGTIRSAGVRYLLSHWDTMPLPYHIVTNMPGKVLLFSAVRLFTDRPRIAAAAVLLLYALGGVPLYEITRRVYKDRGTALIAFVLYLFIPAAVYFMPLLNLVSVVPMLAALLALVLFLETGRAAWAWMTGGLLYAVAFFDPIALCLGSLFVAWGGAAWYTGRRSLPASIVPIVLGFGFIYLAMRLLFQFDLLLA
jgi:hypothetical protein